MAEARGLCSARPQPVQPVVQDGKLAGVVTDRDMYIALATRNKRASETTLGEVVQTPVYTCGPDDDVQAALETMNQHCVRRLSVEGFGGTIMGIVSMNDIVLASGPRRPVRHPDVVSTAGDLRTPACDVPHTITSTVRATPGN